MASHDIPIGAKQASLAALNERSREIFRQIVALYPSRPANPRASRGCRGCSVTAGFGSQCDVGSSKILGLI